MFEVVVAEPVDWRVRAGSTVTVAMSHNMTVT